RRPQPGAVLGIVRGIQFRQGAVWPGPRRRLGGPGGPHLAAPPRRPTEKRMNHLTGDLCGKECEAEEEVRNEVRSEVKAAYDHLCLGAEDLNKDYRAEISKVLRQLEGLSTPEAQDQVFRAFDFDLCAACQRHYVENPLPDPLPPS